MDEEGRRHIFLRICWLHIWEALNKNSFFGTQYFGYTYLWALNDGISIENWFISRAAGSKLNLYGNPSETRHFIQSQKWVKWLRQSIKKKFSTQALSHKCNISIVIYIGLQQCKTRVWYKSRTRTIQFPAVLHTASLSLLSGKIYINVTISASTLSRW